MKVIVCGGRKFSDYHFLFLTLDAIHEVRPISTLLQGGAEGADFWAESWANHHGVPNLTVEANWEKDGRKLAGRKRNHRMLQEKPDLVVAFKGGNGTRHMVEIAENAGIEVIKTWQM